VPPSGEEKGSSDKEGEGLKEDKEGDTEFNKMMQ
jgi:hypothetical protein